MTRTRLATRIRRDGPFFRSDPARTFRANVRSLLEALVAEGTADVVAQLRAGEAGRAEISTGGRVADQVIGRVSSLAGRPWSTWGVVGVVPDVVDLKDVIATRAAEAELERETGAFARTTRRLRAARAANVRELLRGLG